MQCLLLQEMNIKASLTWTRVLMAASMLLLTAFVLYWLNSQYNSEKQALKKELMSDLDRAQREISDSVIYEKYIEPVILGGKDSLTSAFKLNDSVFSFKGEHITYSKYQQSPEQIDSIKKSIKKRKDQAERTLETNTIILDADSSKRMQHTIVLSTSGDDITDYPVSKILNTDNNDSSSNKFDSTLTTFLKSSLRSLMKVVFVDSIKALSLRLNFNDSGLIRNEFENGLAIRNKNIVATWSTDTTFADKQKDRFIYLDYEAYGAKEIVAVSGFTWYLAQKMLPQLGFALLLVVLILFSFIITYKSIKRQIKLNDMKNGLISNMSHELKTPVATVKVALEALDNFGVMNNPTKALEYIQMAKLETQRLEMLISKALNTSLMEQGKITIQREITDIAVLAKETIDLLKIRLAQNGADVKLSLEGNDFEVNIDKLHVQGALLNIIDNSLKYGTSPVEIDIHITARDASVIIDIKDNGPGIPDAYAEQVFEKFFRVPSGDEHTVQGYGLGLSYVQQVMQLHTGVARILPAATGAHFSLQFYKGR